MARGRRGSGNRAPSAHLKSMDSYVLHAWRDAMAIGALLDERVGATRAQRLYKKIKVEDVWNYEDAAEDLLTDFIGRSESQRPAVIRKLPDEATKVCFLTLAIIGCLRVKAIIELRDNYRDVLVPGGGNRQTVRGIYEFSLGAQKLYDYEWPAEVFSALGIDDGEDDDWDDDDGVSRAQVDESEAFDRVPVKPTVPPTPEPQRTTDETEVLVTIGTSNTVRATQGSDKGAWKLQAVVRRYKEVTIILRPEPLGHDTLLGLLQKLAELTWEGRPTLLGLPQGNRKLVEALNSAAGRTIAGVMLAGTTAKKFMKWPEELLRALDQELQLVREPNTNAQELLEMGTLILKTRHADGQDDWRAQRDEVEQWAKKVLAHRGRWIGDVSARQSAMRYSGPEARDLARVKREVSKLAKGDLTHYGNALYSACSALLQWRNGEVSTADARQHVARWYMECCWKDFGNRDRWAPADSRGRGKSSQDLEYALRDFFSLGAIEIDVLEAGLLETMSGPFELGWSEPPRPESVTDYNYRPPAIQRGWFSAWWCVLEFKKAVEVQAGAWMRGAAELERSAGRALPPGVKIRMSDSLVPLDLRPEEGERSWADAINTVCIDRVRQLVAWIGDPRDSYVWSGHGKGIDECLRWGALVVASGPTEKSVVDARQNWAAAAKAIEASLHEPEPRVKRSSAPKSLRVSPWPEGFMDPLCAARERLALMAGWKWNSETRRGTRS